MPANAKQISFIDWCHRIASMNVIVLISDFKFLMAHFYPFLGYVERYRPEMMFMPTDQESVARLGSLMSTWKGDLRYLVV